MFTPTTVITFIVVYMFIHIVLFYLISPKFQLNLDAHLGNLKYLLSFILTLVLTLPFAFISIIGLCVVLFFIGLYNEWTEKLKKEDELKLQENEV